MNKKLSTLNYEINTSVVGRKFTFIQIKDKNNGLVAEGVSRRSHLDRFNEDMGYNVALGRAKKALYLKHNRQRMTHFLMG